MLLHHVYFLAAATTLVQCTSFADFTRNGHQSPTTFNKSSYKYPQHQYPYIIDKGHTIHGLFKPTQVIKPFFSKIIDVRGGDNGDGNNDQTQNNNDNQSSIATNEHVESEASNQQGNLISTGDTSSLNPPSTSKIREVLFPIYGKDVTKFFLMGSIKFFIIMVLTLTRDTKDTLVVTQCGAEAIAFLKIYGVLPAATSFIAVYSRMSSVLGKKQLFYVTCIPFFLFFLLYDTLIYPNRNFIQPSREVIESLLGKTNGGAVEIVSNILMNWSSGLYFIIAELYSSASVGILFWQFANDVVSVEQAKVFYPLFCQVGGIAPIIAGQYVARFASKATNFQSSLHRLTVAISISGIMICMFYYLSTTFIEKETTIADVSEVKKVPKKKKQKISMGESIKFLASSQYLRLVGTLVLGYGLSINFTEIMWKSLLKKKYPNPLDYQRFIGNFSSAVGLATCIVLLFGVHIIRVLGWRIGAMATPAIMSVLAIPFFGCILTGVDNPGRLSTAIVLGTAQSLLSKTSKYAMFDPTTQMAYIPLDEESKVKGKAAIDVLGSRLGKSGGSLIQQGLVLLFGNILGAAPAVCVIYYFVLFGWMSAANELSGLFMAKTEMQKADELAKSV